MSFPSRYPGRCTRCASPIRTGDQIDYDKATKGAWHTGCRAQSVAPLEGPEPGEKAPRTARQPAVTDDQIRTIVEGLVMPEEERAILLRRVLAPAPRARVPHVSTGERTTVTVHTLCCRCGGSAQDGRKMAHLECRDDAEKDLPF